jgi:hypothetical protein
MGEIINSYKSLVGKPKGRHYLEGLDGKCGHNIKKDLMEIG